MPMSDEQSVVLIDEHNLDKECVRLPSDYLKYAHLAAEKKKDVDEGKAKFDLVKAEIANEIRKDPAAFGIEKLTEAGLAAAVLQTDRYQKFQARLQAAQHESDLAQSVVWALEHKKRSLTLLVELHGMGYFSSPKISEKGRDAVEKMTKTAVRRRRDDD